MSQNNKNSVRSVSEKEKIIAPCAGYIVGDDKGGSKLLKILEGESSRDAIRTLLWSSFNTKSGLDSNHLHHANSRTIGMYESVFAHAIKEGDLTLANKILDIYEDRKDKDPHLLDRVDLKISARADYDGGSDYLVSKTKNQTYLFACLKEAAQLTSEDQKEKKEEYIKVAKRLVVNGARTHLEQDEPFGGETVALVAHNSVERLRLRSSAMKGRSEYGLRIRYSKYDDQVDTLFSSIEKDLTEPEKYSRKLTLLEKLLFEKNHFGCGSADVVGISQKDLSDLVLNFVKGYAGEEHMRYLMQDQLKDNLSHNVELLKITAGILSKAYVERGAVVKGLPEIEDILRDISDFITKGRRRGDEEKKVDQATSANASEAYRESRRLQLLSNRYDDLRHATYYIAECLPQEEKDKIESGLQDELSEFLSRKEINAQKVLIEEVKKGSKQLDEYSCAEFLTNFEKISNRFRDSDQSLYLSEVELVKDFLSLILRRDDLRLPEKSEEGVVKMVAFVYEANVSLTRMKEFALYLNPGSPWNYSNNDGELELGDPLSLEEKGAQNVEILQKQKAILVRFLDESQEMHRLLLSDTKYSDGSNFFKRGSEEEYIKCVESQFNSGIGDEKNPERSNDFLRICDLESLKILLCNPDNIKKLKESALKFLTTGLIVDDLKKSDIELDSSDEHRKSKFDALFRIAQIPDDKDQAGEYVKGLLSNIGTSNCDLNNDEVRSFNELALRGISDPENKKAAEEALNSMHQLPKNSVQDPAKDSLQQEGRGEERK